MTYYVAMTDSFMSGWGIAKNKTNRFVIECDTYEQAAQIEAAGHARSEMKRISINLHCPRDSKRTLVSLRHYNDLGECWKPEI